MGDDIMGSSTFIPRWVKIDDNASIYNRKVSYLSGNNKIIERSFECKTQKNNQKLVVEIWDIEFVVTKFDENSIQIGDSAESIPCKARSPVLYLFVKFSNFNINYSFLKSQAHIKSLA